DVPEQGCGMIVKHPVVLGTNHRCDPAGRHSTQQQRWITKNGYVFNQPIIVPCLLNNVLIKILNKGLAKRITISLLAFTFRREHKGYTCSNHAVQQKKILREKRSECRMLHQRHTDLAHCWKPKGKFTPH